MICAQRIALKRIIESLRDEPLAWTINEYEATCRDMTVWIGNGHYGIDFQLGRIRWSSNCFPFWFVNPFGWWRVTLLRACRDADAAQMRAALS
jgi:hypothetical protein